MRMHSCFDCEFRKLPLKDTPCDKGVVEKGGLVLQCLGWRERKSNKFDKKLEKINNEK